MKRVLQPNEYGLAPSPANVSACCRSIIWALICSSSRQVHRLHPPRGQQRRGRHPRAARARAAAASSGTTTGDGDAPSSSARPLRRRAALRRRHHHARRSRCSARWKGSRSPRRRSTHVVVPVTFVILLRALHRAAARHRRQSAPCSARSCCSGSSRSPCSVRVEIVRAPRDARARSTRGTACSSSSTHGRARLPHPRRGRPLRHRRRGALRRHGALRQAADPARLLRARAPGAAAELLRPGRAAAARPGGGGEPVLSARAAGGSCIRCSSSRRWRRSSRRRR